MMVMQGRLNKYQKHVVLQDWINLENSDRDYHEIPRFMHFHQEFNCLFCSSDITFIPKARKNVDLLYLKFHILDQDTVNLLCCRFW